MLALPKNIVRKNNQAELEIFCQVTHICVNIKFHFNLQRGNIKWALIIFGFDAVRAKENI